MRGLSGSCQISVSLVLTSCSTLIWYGDTNTMVSVWLCRPQMLGVEWRGWIQAILESLGLYPYPYFRHPTKPASAPSWRVAGSRPQSAHGRLLAKPALPARKAERLLAC